MEQFTASEVRDEIAGTQCAIDNAGFGSEGRAAFASYAMDNIGKWKRMLRAYADRLEAQEKAVPVAWRTFDGEGNYDYRDYENNEHYRDWYVSRNGAKYANWVEPLYTHPAPSGAERLADALRELLDDIDLVKCDFCKCHTWCSVEDSRKSLIKHEAHSAQAQPPAASVTDAMVEDGCMAWNKSAGLGYAVADRDCMRAAIEAALAAQENPNGV